VCSHLYVDFKLRHLGRALTSQYGATKSVEHLSVVVLGNVLACAVKMLESRVECDDFRVLSQLLSHFSAERRPRRVKRRVELRDNAHQPTLFLAVEVFHLKTPVEKGLNLRSISRVLDVFD